MFTAIDVRKLLSVQPFEPFRIHLSDGSHYDIRHPDLVVVFFRKLEILIPAKKAKSDLIFEPKSATISAAIGLPKITL